MAIKQLSVNKGTQDLFFLKTVVRKKEGEKTLRTVSLILHFRGKLISWQLAKRSVWAFCL